MRQLFTTVITLVAIALGGSAAAQPGCGDYDSMITRLSIKYGEVRLGIGRTRSNLFELWASEETGTWTILEVFPSGMACMKAAGDKWKADPPAVPGAPV